MTPRKIIFTDKSMAHVFFRCHNKSMFLQPNSIKNYFLDLLAKYKDPYRIKIFDFAILDNHVHLFLWAPNARCLGDFMRTVESLLARRINKVFERDSQALRERYKSPIVCGYKYGLNLIKYIYANRYKVTGVKPHLDYYCSAHWRMVKPHKAIENPSNADETRSNRLSRLLDHYTDPDINEASKRGGFIESLVSELSSTLDDYLNSKIFSSSHTIGDSKTMDYRTEVIRAFRRETGPPLLGAGVSSAFLTI